MKETPICANCTFYRRSIYSAATSIDDTCVRYVRSTDIVRGTKHHYTCWEMRSNETLCGYEGKQYLEDPSII